MGMEQENGTGNSYFYDSLTGDLIPASFKDANNKSTKVNWVIRAVGEQKNQADFAGWRKGKNADLQKCFFSGLQLSTNWRHNSNFLKMGKYIPAFHQNLYMDKIQLIYLGVII